MVVGTGWFPVGCNRSRTQYLGAHVCPVGSVYASQQEQRGIRTGLFLLVAYLLAEWSWPVALGVVFISRSRLTVLVVYVLGILSVWYGEGRMFPLPDLDLGSIRTSLYASVRTLISDWVWVWACWP